MASRRVSSTRTGSIPARRARRGGRNAGALLLGTVVRNRGGAVLSPRRPRVRRASQAKTGTLGGARGPRPARPQPSAGAVVARGISRVVREARTALRSRDPWKRPALPWAGARAEEQGAGLAPEARRRARLLRRAEESGCKRSSARAAL